MDCCALATRIDPDGQRTEILSTLSLLNLDGASEIVRLLQKTTGVALLVLPDYDAPGLVHPPATVAMWQRAVAAMCAPKPLGERWRALARAVSDPYLAGRIEEVATLADAFPQLAGVLTEEVQLCEEDLADWPDRSQLESYWMQKEWRAWLAGVLLRRTLGSSARAPDAQDACYIVWLLRGLAQDLGDCVLCGASLELSFLG